ncbi:MAG: hypothetical protein H0T65_05480, partial [Deltaproteobacteria bacterium]|nr:hypothetical protein [Deltaproteobacteria bacterium]
MAVGAAVVVVAAVIIALVLRESPKAVAPAVSLPSAGAAPASQPPKIEVVPRAKVSARVMLNGAAKADVQVWITDGSRPVFARAWTDRDGQVV